MPANRRFIFRRMLIFAGEDVGMADPNAIQMVTACADAFEQVGLPEGRFHLGLAALYLATAEVQLNFALFERARHGGARGRQRLPAHLRDASRDAEGFGHGEGYLYPHAYRDHWVAQHICPRRCRARSSTSRPTRAMRPPSAWTWRRASPRLRLC